MFNLKINLKEFVMTTPTRKDDLTLVLGGNGKTGRRVVERLRAAGHDVRAASRSTQPRFDWEDHSTWAATLEGARRAYIAYQPDIAVPGALATLTALFDQAVRSGVKRLVLLSGRGEVEAEEAEEALKASGADWTILRCSWFAQNFSENFLVESIRAGIVALPVQPVPEPFIDVEDIAEAAMVALTQRGHSGQLYEMTGRSAVSFPDAVALIARTTGRDIRFMTVPAEDYRAELQQAGLSPVEVDLILYLMTTILDGRNEKPTDGAQHILGRPAGDFADYVRRTAATGVWSA
jgi:uncharacterized protein YbjT (DUF2867 family)